MPSADYDAGGSPHLFALPSDSVQVTSDDCYTPRWLFEAMGLHFDLDVASPPGGPWHVPCDRYYTAEDDGLAQPWDGLVWCNPPFSNFKPWGFRWAECERGVIIGTYAPETYATPAVFAAADAVAFIGVKFALPAGGWIKPRHGCYVAFRGTGVSPAERLAAADPYGAVLYGHTRVIPPDRG